jgi:predicted CoA-binding protein
MKNQKQNIENFLMAKTIAIIGASRNKKKFGNQVLKNLVSKGYDVYPVNPYAEEIEGIKCYNNVSLLPENVKTALIVTPKKETEKTVKELINKGITNIWIQQMSETTESIDIALKSNVNLIANKCIFMFAEPVSSIHKFHRTIKKLFGSLYN